MQELNEAKTHDLLDALLSREGVEYEQVYAGREIAYTPPKDAYFIVVPPDAMPKQESVKERLDALKLAFMERLLHDYEHDMPEAGALLAQMLKGGG